ncbi:Predicted ester cyclase [Nocardia amikacinitolerans]|uniref:Predicted ester cyclase n=1 Tax=Nocardia amikacinitolerans TaxID=756689 RepID=A0A285LZB3_9NOCA|nr:ester cyclase [Nocardia amikacinitolerans]SNY88641.1 Predicted ester cyclase [Nocardia amikacinitolerans]
MAARHAAALVEQFLRFLRTGDEQVATRTFATDIIDHVSGQRGLDIWRTLHGWLTATLADPAFDVHAIMSDGDRLMVWVTMRGRHIGNGFPNLTHLPITGREVAADAVHIFRITDGKLTEHWAVRDDLGLLRQLEPDSRQ